MQQIIGLVKQRNGKSLIKRCVEHALKICDKVIIYDDASDDRETITILANLYLNDNITIIQSDDPWKYGNREPLETIHRQILLEAARKDYGPDMWLYYFDMDEVIPEPYAIRDKILKNWDKMDGWLIRLFDAHATQKDQAPYVDQPLLDFRQMFCPKYRDILMFWKNHTDVNFLGVDKREPNLRGNAQYDIIGYCQHYGKALSEELWEEKCEYYVNHFSKRYADKWEARKGKYIHTFSDFGAPLDTWKNLIQRYSI